MLFLRRNYYWLWLLLITNFYGSDEVLRNITLAINAPPEAAENVEKNTAYCLRFNSFDQQGNFIARHKVEWRRKSGNFILEKIPPHAASLRMWGFPENNATVDYLAVAPIDLSAKEPIKVDLKAITATKIEIEITNNNGKPLSNSDAYLRDTFENKDLSKKTLDANGRLVFYGYPSVGYQIQVIDEGRIDRFSPIYEIEREGKPLTAKWQLPPYRSIEVEFCEEDGEKIIPSTKVTNIIVIVKDREGNPLGSYSTGVKDGKIWIFFGGWFVPENAGMFTFELSYKSPYSIIAGESVTVDKNEKRKKHRVVFAPVNNRGFSCALLDAENKQPLTGVVYWRQQKNNEVRAISSTSTMKLETGKYDLIAYVPDYELQRINDIEIISSAKNINLKLKKAPLYSVTIKPLTTQETIAFKVMNTIKEKVKPLSGAVSTDTLSLTLNCDPRLQPFLLLAQNSAAISAIPLTRDNIGKSLNIALQKGVTIRGKISPTMLDIIRNEYAKIVEQSTAKTATIFRESTAADTLFLQVVFFPLMHRGIFVAGATVAADGTWQTQILPGKYRMAILISGACETVAEFTDPLEVPEGKTDFVIEKFSTPESEQLKFIHEEEYFFRQNLFEVIK